MLKKKVQHTNCPNYEQDLVHSEVGHLLNMHRPGAPSPAAGEKHWTQAEGASDHSLLFCLLTGRRLDSGHFNRKMRSGPPLPRIIQLLRECVCGN